MDKTFASSIQISILAISLPLAMAVPSAPQLNTSAAIALTIALPERVTASASTRAFPTG